MTLQQQLKAKLEAAGIPHHEIRCYGSQVVVTVIGRETAQRWAVLLGEFCRRVQVLDTPIETQGWRTKRPSKQTRMGLMVAGTI